MDFTCTVGTNAVEFVTTKEKGSKPPTVGLTFRWHTHGEGNEVRATNYGYVTLSGLGVVDLLDLRDACTAALDTPAMKRDEERVRREMPEALEHHDAINAPSLKVRS